MMADDRSQTTGQFDAIPQAAIDALAGFPLPDQGLTSLENYRRVLDWLYNCNRTLSRKTNVIRIYLNEETRELGCCTTKVYESQVGYVTIGTSNAYRNVQPVIHADVMGLAEVHGGRREITEWKELATDAARDDWMVAKVIGGLTVEMFREIVSEAEERGRRWGVENIQRDLRKVLGLR